MNKIMTVVTAIGTAIGIGFNINVEAGSYSEGYRMGQLTKFSVKGMFSKSGEGQMLMGSESTPYIITTTDSKGVTTKKTINPWYFSSSNKAMHRKIDSAIGEYVVIKYKQSHIRNVFAADTDYEVVSVSPINPKLSKTCKAKNYIQGSKSKGKRVGRIVKASTKGTFTNSYEIMIQQGNSGNQFKNMSISKDKRLFDCAISYLKAGQKVKIYYNESLINTEIFSRNTAYEIIKIEPISGLN